MSRFLARTARLLKFGAVAGIAVGVGRAVLRRRRNVGTGESSWPTIAETAAEGGSPVSDPAAGSEGTGAEESEADGGAETGSDSDQAGTEDEDEDEEP